jgi:hypothetical protein
MASYDWRPQAAFFHMAAYGLGRTQRKTEGIMECKYNIEALGVSGRLKDGHTPRYDRENRL